MLKNVNGKWVVIDGEEENQELCRLFKCPPGTEREIPVKRKCPICGAVYEGYPAISRKDNKTEICPECGTMEALDAKGVSPEVKEEILNMIKEARKGARGI